MGPHIGRGLCQRCYQRHRYHGELIDFERRSKPIRDVVEDFIHLDLDRNLSLNRRFELAAPRLGMTHAALSKAYYRAQKNGRWVA